MTSQRPQFDAEKTSGARPRASDEVITSRSSDYVARRPRSVLIDSAQDCTEHLGNVLPFVEQ